LPDFPLDCAAESRKSEIDAIRFQSAGGNLFPQAAQDRASGVGDRSLAFAGQQAGQLAMAH
jgi:hypothetical protein